MPIESKLRLLMKLKAHRLYVKKLNTATETARQTGITIKTMGLWIKAGNWLAERDKIIEKVLANDDPPVIPEIVVLDLLEFIKETAPHLAQRVQPIVNSYLSQL